jgi:methylmalonyl-CoA mutase N-terminal domain/subunit
MRFHAQTAGSSLTAQQPENNIVRTSLQALAAVLGGTQSLHTNAFDEALGLPTEQSARTALRTQQIVGFESGVADTIDPLAGSYFVESLTDALEGEAMVLLDKVEAMGGAVAAIEQGFVQSQIADSAYAAAQRIESGETEIVGVNRFTTPEPTTVPVAAADSSVEEGQVRRLEDLRQRRDQAAVDASLDAVKDVARGDGNLLQPMRAALASLATVGEVSSALREMFGSYRPAV